MFRRITNCIQMIRTESGNMVILLQISELVSWLFGYF